ncbi:MAG: FlgD immunoglobulin-like domain containing protein [candidate division WOR-3 bacterium]|nr:FlgD immunoglobulin-like domain containing protein [candidate division WOR-3 bacterium]
MSKKLFAAALILSFAVLAFAAPQDVIGGKVLPATDGLGTTPVEGGSVSWASAPKAIPNGWYWMYDNAETGPPFSVPSVPGLPSFEDITSDGNKLAPYNDQPYKYTLPDSFWYYGYWYEPGDHLYISPDGWVSLDPAASAGFPDPPTASPPFPVTDPPNAIMAALWQDMNPTQTPEPTCDTNRVYHRYTAMPSELIVQWYKTQGHANTRTYDFELSLSMGGQLMLMTEGECGVVFSFHFIHFLYNTSSDGWTADGGKTGIENQSGERGIYYQGTLNDGRVIRAGYKRIFKHDVQAYVFLSPATTVLRFTDIQPKLIVRNIGEETEHFPVTFDIYDEDDNSLVYHFNVSVNNLLPGEYDTIVGPCWTPGELYPSPDTHSYRKVAFSLLDRDECKHNDTLVDTSIVHCDGWLTPYAWNIADFPNAVAFRMYRMATSFDMNNGTYVLGGRVFMGWRDPNNPMYSDVPPRLEVWASQNGCGGVPNGSYSLGGGNYIGPAEWLKWHPIIFDKAVWVSTADPGNFWMACANSLDPGASIFVGWLPYLGMSPPPALSSCHTAYYPGRSGYWRTPNGASGPSSYFRWGGMYARYHTHPIEPLTHLGFSPMPAPPCYYELAHDLTCYSMEQPASEYVEADVAITPNLAIANIGLQTEPDADFFTVGFIAVEEETSDTAFHETSLVSGPLEQGDTIYATTAPWTPEGLCDEYDPFVYYELIGYVLLGRVGPDYSDHCPYNDTIRRNVTCLLSHDVGVIDMTWPELPDEEPDVYYPGSKITVTATVENFGINSEHDVEVRLEVRDVDSNDVELFHALKSIPFINWRGNEMGDPYTVDVTFPTYDVANDHRQKLECRTELLNDACPDDDKEVREINTGIAETPAGLPFALDAITPNPFVGSTTISFAVPATVSVSLKVYDITGKLVTTLVSGNQAPGHHSVVWNGTDDLGRSVAQGIYLVRMDAASFSATKKVVLY